MLLVKTTALETAAFSRAAFKRSISSMRASTSESFFCWAVASREAAWAGGGDAAVRGAVGVAGAAVAAPAGPDDGPDSRGGGGRLDADLAMAVAGLVVEVSSRPLGNARGLLASAAERFCSSCRHWSRAF